MLEERKHSLSSHVKNFRENSKVLETPSILPDLANYTKYQNTWETSKIPDDLFPVGPGVGLSQSPSRLHWEGLSQTLVNWHVSHGVQEKQLHYYINKIFRGGFYC